MAALPAGKFAMGDAGGRYMRPVYFGDQQIDYFSFLPVHPAHCVTIRKPFAIGRFEVTRKQWDLCVEAGACRPRVPAFTARVVLGDDYPTANLDPDMADDYVRWLAEVTGKPYRLPTEPEWEYAARAGSRTLFWWGDKTLPLKENFMSCTYDGRPCQGGEIIRPVGSYEPNPFGLYDMLGNLSEWTGGCGYHYSGATGTEAPPETEPCEHRMIRGGHAGMQPLYANTVYRESGGLGPLAEKGATAGSLPPFFGFRVARDLELASD